MVEKKLRVFEAFAGIGSQSKAMGNLGVPYEIVGISEWGLKQTLGYCLIHHYEEYIYIKNNIDVSNTSKESLVNFIYSKGMSIDTKKPVTESYLNKLPMELLLDYYISIQITKNIGSVVGKDVSSIPDHDLFTYSFPCQDISIQGRQQGFEEGSGTRSSLLWECKYIIENIRPKYLLLENVKQLVGKQHKEGFKNWLNYLEGIGYTNYWKVINSKNFNNAQSRERVFVVSIFGEHEPFNFPTGSNENKTLASVIYEKYPEEGIYSNLDTFENILEVATSNEYNYNYNSVSRYITGDESLRLMGFDDEDIEKLNTHPITQTNVFKCFVAGNSIVVNVLEGLFGELLQVPHTYNTRTSTDEELNIIKVNSKVFYDSNKSTKTKQEFVELIHKDMGEEDILEMYTDISTSLNIPLGVLISTFIDTNRTMMPTKRLWVKVRNHLNLSAEELAITDGIIKDIYVTENLRDQSRRTYLDLGVAPTLSTRGAIRMLIDKETI